MFLSEKLIPVGRFIKLKSRIKVGDDMKSRSLYSDVSSRTASNTSEFMARSMAAYEEYHGVTNSVPLTYMPPTYNSPTRSAPTMPTLLPSRPSTKMSKSMLALHVPQ